MEYIESEDCNKSLSDIVNCSLPYEQGTEFSPLKPEAVAVPFTFALIFLLGVSGNTLLILNFARHKKLNTAHNALVVNLAAGDLLMLTIGVPFNSTWYTLPYWPFGLLVCKLSRFVETLATAVTIATLAALSVERFLIVTVRRRYLSQSSLAPLVVVVVMWAVGFVLALPDLMSATVQSAANRTNTTSTVEYCLDFNPSWGSDYPKTNVLCRFLLLFVVPLLVIGPCYAALAYHLFFRMYRTRDTPTSKTPLKSAAISMATRGSSVRTGSPALLRMSSFADDGPGQVHDDDVVVGANDNEADASCLQNNSSNCSKSIKNSNSNNNTPALKRQRLALTVLALVLAFIVCWLPRHIYLLWFHFDPSQFSYFWHVFKISGFCLMFSNSAVNPFVFYVVDDHFRTHVHETLLCRRRVRGRDDGEDATTRGRDLAAADDTAADDKNTYIPMSEMPTCTERLEYV